jgi:hypothetical protein|tara:strand:- start:289 stop:507 length:219 start_codon:yes stop_codon:yes gene_type:complete
MLVLIIIIIIILLIIKRNEKFPNYENLDEYPYYRDNEFPNTYAIGLSKKNDDIYDNIYHSIYPYNPNIYTLL